MVPESPTATNNPIEELDEELLDESSCIEQEMMVRLKHEIKKMCKIFFI